MNTKTRRHIVHRDRDKRCKLTQAQVDEIQHDYLTTNITQTALAKKYGVRQPTICFIVSPFSKENQRNAMRRAYIKRKAKEIRT